MPACDGTGPMEMGQKMDQGAGCCAGAMEGSSVSSASGRGRGMGFGRGCGRGRGHGGGRGRCYRGGASERMACNSNPQVGEAACGQELEMLRRQAERLKKAHEEICERINDLEKPEAAQNE